MEQASFNCTIMRGGTSKAIFMKKNELPYDEKLRDKIVLAIFGSPDVRQIDGLGGSDITTSKLAVIGPPTRDDADIDYTFGQVSLTEDLVDYTSNCGNISAAVGPYAIDEGMVKVSEPVTEVKIFNTNTQKILVARIPVKDGRAVVGGNFILDGVPGSGAKIELDYKMTAGAATGKLLPTGNVVDKLNVQGLGEIEVSIVDIANSVVFVNAKDLDISGVESRSQIMANSELLDKLEAIRAAAACACGFIKEGEDARKLSPLRPMIAFVSPAVDYMDYASKNMIHKDDIDFVARIMFNQMAVETYTGTGTICTSVAAMIEGTIVNKVASQRINRTGAVQFGHARGINRVEVGVTKQDGQFIVEKAVFARTARRILDGRVYVKKERIEIE